DAPATWRARRRQYPARPGRRGRAELGRRDGALDERAAGEDEAPLASERRRPEAPGHVRWCLPEVSGPHVMLHTVLDADPLAIAPRAGSRFLRVEASRGRD